MKNEIKHTNFENLIKQKLDNFELPFNESGWEDFSKELPKQNFFKTKLFYSLATVAVISSILIYCLTNNSNILKSDNSSTKENQISENIEIKESNTIEFSSNENDNKIENSEISVNNNINDNIDNKDIIKEENSESIIIEENETEIEETEINNTNSVNNITKNLDLIPNSKYSASILKGCEPLQVKFTPKEIADSIIYLWEFGDGTFSNEANPVHEFKNAGKYQVSLTTKYYHFEKLNKNNEVIINVLPKPKSDFKYKKEDNRYTFTANSKKSDRYEWYINDQYFNSPIAECDFEKECVCKVKLISLNNNGCADTINKKVNIKIDFIVYMPNAFKPNGDGMNDYFGPVINEIGNRSFYFKIVNGFGQTVFESYDYNVKWDGNIKNSSEAAPAGKYAWEIIIKDSNKIIEHKSGYVNLQR